MIKQVTIADICRLTGRDRQAVTRWKKDRPRLYLALVDAVKYQRVKAIINDSLM